MCGLILTSFSPLIEQKCPLPVSKVDLSPCALTLSSSTSSGTHPINHASSANAVVASEMCRPDPLQERTGCPSCWNCPAQTASRYASFRVCTPSPGSPHPVTDRSSCGKARPFQPNAEQLRGPFSFLSDARLTLSPTRRPAPAPTVCPVHPCPPCLPHRRNPGPEVCPDSAHRSGETLLACLYTSHRAIVGTMAFFLPTFLLGKLLGAALGPLTLGPCTSEAQGRWAEWWG